MEQLFWFMMGALAAISIVALLQTVWVNRFLEKRAKKPW